MDEEIILSGPGFVIARSKTPKTMTGYAPDDHGDGTLNFGFLDLRDRPELVTMIPELKKSLGLAAIVRAANHPHGSIMSLGCECAAFPVDERRADGFTHYVGGFVDLTYRDGDVAASAEQLTSLATDILKRVHIDKSKHFVTFEMVIEPLKSHFGRRGCYSLMVKLIAFGSDEKHAWASFDICATALASAIRATEMETNC